MQSPSSVSPARLISFLVRRSGNADVCARKSLPATFPTSLCHIIGPRGFNVAGGTRRNLMAAYGGGPRSRAAGARLLTREDRGRARATGGKQGAEHAPFGPAIPLNLGPKNSVLRLFGCELLSEKGCESGSLAVSSRYSENRRKLPPLPLPPRLLCRLPCPTATALLQPRVAAPCPPGAPHFFWVGLLRGSSHPYTASSFFLPALAPFLTLSHPFSPGTLVPTGTGLVNRVEQL